MPDGTQTHDLWLRRPTLYSTKLRAYVFYSIKESLINQKLVRQDIGFFLIYH